MLSKYSKFPLIVLLLLTLGTPSKAQTAPSKALIQPFAGAPLCTSHNANAWHGLWDYARGCHYDHTHNDDPAAANAIFGAPGSTWGQNVSYPWMTANENNEHGHPGYKYYVNVSPQPACAKESYEYLGAVNCVSAFRIQYHDAGGNAHMVKRFHSYYMEAQIQKGSVVGTIQTGGWADFGCLHSSYKETFLPLPGIDPVNSNGQSVCGNGQSIHSDPYRAPGDTWQEIQGRTSGDNFWIWTAHDSYGYNKLGFFFFRTLDSWGSIDASDPYAERFLCPDFRCKFNNSEHHVFNVFMMIPASLDADRDGIVNYTGYTDRQGNIVPGCTAPGANCVPLKITNAPVGTAIWSRNLSGIRPPGDPVRDHDIYFNGQPSGWIQFSSHTQNPVPTNTPAVTRTQTPAVTATRTSTGTAVTSPTASPVLPSPTMMATATRTPVVPTAPPGNGDNTLLPLSLTTSRGTSSGSVQSLSVRDQSNTQDNPGSYILFQPTDNPYQGYQSFTLPGNTSSATITSMNLLLNIRTSGSARQKWTISIYDWSQNSWVNLTTLKGGDGPWREIRLDAGNDPARFVSVNNEIRIQFKASRRDGNIKVDYEAIQIGVGSAVGASSSTSSTSVQEVGSPTPTVTTDPNHHHDASPTPKP